MAHKIVQFDRFLRKAVLMFVAALAVMTLAQPAHACYTCVVPLEGNPYCWPSNPNSGWDICVSGNGYCRLFGHQLCGDTCPPEGCPAKIEEPLIHRHARLRNASYADDKVVKNDAPMTAELFEKMANEGRLSGPGVVVYMDHRVPLAQDLMKKVPANHWKKFQIGFETDPKTGKQRTMYDIETVIGNKVHVVLN